MALSLIAVLFTALPTKAALNYTGTVTTTDNAGAAKTNFIQGEPVYLKVEAMNGGVLSDQQITVSLVRTNDGHLVSSFTTRTNDPVVGWYNSTQAVGHLTLSTSHAITGDIQSYNVIVTLPSHGGIEIARSQITVRAVGMTLTPAPFSPAYWPGEVITITLVVTLAQTSDVFYVQVVNETGVNTNVNFTSQTATSGYWTNTFSIGATLPDGRYTVNVRAQADHSFWYSQDFDVQMFEFMVQSQRDAYLPGETAKITYLVLDLATLARITSGITIYYNASYQNKTGNLTWKNGTLDATNTTWEFTLPTNGTSTDSIALYSNVDISFNARMPAGERNVTQTLTLLIGSISASVSVNSANYAPGDTVVVTVDANVLGDSLDGANVDVTVLKNGNETIAAYGATGLTTNLDGTATYMFKLAESADLGMYNYIVTATVTKVGYSAVRQTQFTVESSSHLVIALDQAYYYGGQEATATFAAILNNMPASVVDIGYIFEMGPVVLATGNTTGTSATVLIPDGSSGTLDVVAFTHINGEIVSGFDSAPVYFALLGLTPAESTYRPGDTVVFQWTVVTGLTSADLSYEVFDSNGVRVANGTPAFEKTGSFEFVVPAAGPLLSTSYDATLRMTTPEGAFESATASVNIVSLTELTISIGKSSYTSGEFAPGQKISIHYDLSSFVTSARPTVRLHVSVSYDPSTFDVVVTSSKGTISYTIPKDAPMAPHTVTVVAYDAATGDFLASDQSAFQVNNQVSGWSMSVGGISMIDLVLLILLIVVIIMLIVVPYMKDRMERPKVVETKYVETTPAPPAEQGKTPPSP